MKLSLLVFLVFSLAVCHAQKIGNGTYYELNKNSDDGFSSNSSDTFFLVLKKIRNNVVKDRMELRITGIRHNENKGTDHEIIFSTANLEQNKNVNINTGLLSHFYLINRPVYLLQNIPAY